MTEILILIISAADALFTWHIIRSDRFPHFHIETYIALNLLIVSAISKMSIPLLSAEHVLDAVLLALIFNLTARCVWAYGMARMTKPRG